MDQQQPDATRPLSLHQAHDAEALSVAEAIRAGSFIPAPTPLQTLEAQQRFIGAIAAERARAGDQQGRRRAR